ncbi:hypothetical protein CHLRE_02g089000v5 [Chlamydomonas reinhardtii]|uniref:Uncharacterized protein n=1 Tax=Chlamydomonas reinhardtii TaxID=3055 RepID=A0A2K3E137_CHLRE|nr:uncharacterized protein CHLRE_02g089000v5 [Chlamydomonas reinhardtii]PNW86498.1 hypothetical protein CHLRE_02g089000v5 [Chlamydomonas reinhardtii]
MSAAKGIPNSFYWKLSGICFVIGGCMEGFMYATGFYDIVTKKEAEKYVESLEERQELLRKLRERGLLEGTDIGLTTSPAGDASRR